MAPSIITKKDTFDSDDFDLHHHSIVDDIIQKDNQKEENDIQNQIYHEYGLCGIANIPNQQFHISSHDVIDVNFLLIGNVCCGKSSFINRSLGTGDERIGGDGGNGGIISDTTEYDLNLKPIIRKIETMVVDRDVKVMLSLIDLPQMGHSITKKDCIPSIKEYLKNSFLMSDKEIIENQRHIRDSRVHVALLFLEEHQMFLSDDDISLIKSLSSLTNVFIIIPKADLLLIEEWEIIQARIQSQLKEEELGDAGIGPLLFRDELMLDLHKNIPQTHNENGLSDTIPITIFPSFKDERKKLLLGDIDLGLEGLLFKKFLPTILKGFKK